MRWIAAGIAVVAIMAVAVIFLMRPANTAAVFTAGDATILSASHLQSVINATGTVESANSTNVYSTLSYKVDALLADVGDYVHEGDLLCTLNTGDLEKQILSKETAINASAASAQQQIKAARDTYNASKTALNEGTNSSVISAENTVNTAYNNWQKAQKTYDDYVSQMQRGENSNVMAQEIAVRNAQSSMTSAQIALEQARRELDDASAALNAYSAPSGDQPTAQSDYNSLLNTHNTMKANYDTKYQSYESAMLSLDNANRQLIAAQNTAGTTLDDYAIAVETNYQAYLSALESLEAARASAQSSLQANKNSVSSAQASTNNDLALLELSQLKENLADAKVAAPVSGMVTAVYATVGTSASGLLFVIEDVSNLIVNTTIKEYDVGIVKPGMRVAIKSDATGGAVHDGKITTIAPTSKKDSSGKTVTSGDILFPTEVSVLSQDSGLRIGMSVRLTIVVDERDGVLAVPYDAVYRNDNGQSCVIVAEEQEDGGFILREAPVTTGIESDLSIEVSGEGIREGMRVMDIAANYRDMIGQTVTLAGH